MTPLLSIIITIYNKEPYIAEALESVINQTIREIEIICVDDGSNDGSGLIIDEYAKRDSRIIVIHQENEGLVNARRTGIYNANAKYIGFIDADDWVDPQMFQRLYEEMIMKKLDFISSGTFIKGKKMFDAADEMIYITEDDKQVLFSTVIWNYEANNHGIVPNIVAKLFKRELLIDTCKDISSCLHYHEGDSFVYSYIIYCKAIGILHEAYYHIRSVENSDSSIIDEYFFARQNVFYVFLKNKFRKTLYFDLLMPQLDYYIARTMIYGINHRAGLGLDAEISAHFILANSKRNKIIVYGAGKYGKKIIDKIITSRKHQLIAIIDQNLEKGEINGYDIQRVDYIKTVEFDVIVIAIEDEIINRKVFKLLRSMDVPANKIEMGSALSGI